MLGTECGARRCEGRGWDFVARHHSESIAIVVFGGPLEAPEVTHVLIHAMAKRLRIGLREGAVASALGLHADNALLIPFGRQAASDCHDRNGRSAASTAWRSVPHREVRLPHRGASGLLDRRFVHRTTADEKASTSTNQSRPGSSRLTRTSPR
jgi:hypothetical protein